LSFSVPVARDNVVGRQPVLTARIDPNRPAQACAGVFEPTMGASMSREKLFAYCLDKPGAWVDEPWEGDQVIKVGDKIFAFFGSPDSDTVGLKCAKSKDDPEAKEWRDQYPEDVTVTAYIGRYGWNTFAIGSAISDAELTEAVDASYQDIVARLPKSKRPA